MENPVINEDVIRKYLLGELSDNEREQIEKYLLVNDEFFHNLTTLEEMVEDELIDQYVSGGLAGGERKKFEQLFLSSPERREKLYLARDLNEYVSSAVVDPRINALADDDSRHWWRALFAFRNLSRPLVGALCVLLIAIASFAWLFFRTRQHEAELERLRAGRQSFPPEVGELTEQLDRLRARNEELAAKLRDSEAGRARAEQEAAALASAGRQSRGTSDSAERTANNVASSRTGSSVIPLALSMVSRSPENEPFKVLNLSPKVGRVQLYLNLDDIDPTDYDGFRVELKKRRDETLVRRISVRARAGQKRLVVQLPSKLLTEGEYVVELNGLFNRGQSESVGAYLFRVAQQK